MRKRVQISPKALNFPSSFSLYKHFSVFVRPRPQKSSQRKLFVDFLLHSTNTHRRDLNKNENLPLNIESRKYGDNTGKTIKLCH